MKALKQLLRQPIKTVIGILLVALASAIFCLCAGQALAAQTTTKILNRQFSTIGIPLVQEDMDGNLTADSFMLEDEFLSWLENMAVQHPDIVQKVARHGILSAYIPSLTPLNITQQPYQYQSNGMYSYQASPETMPYSCAMLVITLETVSEPKTILGTYPVEDLSPDDFATQSDYDTWLHTDPDVETVTAVQGYSVTLRGTVTAVVSMGEGYRDPVGRFACLTFTAPTLEEVYALDLVPGEQYIVYGMDYTDEHWKLVSALDPNGLLDYLDLDTYDPRHLYLLTEKEKRENAQWAEAFPELSSKKDIFATYRGIELTEQQYLQLNTVSLTLDTPVPLTRYRQVRDALTGKLVELVPETQIVCGDAYGQTVTYGLDEYRNRYAIPTIARLNGPVDAFLNSADGLLWKQALERMTVNNRAFAVVGVEKMDYLADFSLRRSQITDGRDFTWEELETGQRVCIIHDTLALANGISPGDTITLHFYRSDYSLPYQAFPPDGKGLLNPSASFYYDTTPFTETAEYTVVGLWHAEQLWPDVAQVSAYAFSPNTVFIPVTSAQTPMETRGSIVFNTLVLQNGKIGAFHDLAMHAGFAGRLKYHDQDYSVIAANFHNYDMLTQQALVIGAVLYGVLLMLFLLFYPGVQKKTVLTMQALGAGFFHRFGYVAAGTLGIAVSASVLGGWAGAQLWDRFAAALQLSSGSGITLQLEPGTLSLLALIQPALVLIPAVCAAATAAAPKRMSSGR